MIDTATVALTAAIISGGVSLWNSRKTNANSLEIESMKGTVGRDLARLNAKLSHGQLINSMQWNAEFTAYQAIWKEMVTVRTLGDKIVLRESELGDLGLPSEYLASVDRAPIRMKLLKEFVEASKRLLVAIHDSAPFYPAPIREAANKTHRAAKDLFTKYLSAFTQQTAAGIDVTGDAQFINGGKTLLLALFEGVDQVESLMRERLEAVQVVNTASVSD
jgi:cytochrome c556